MSIGPYSMTTSRDFNQMRLGGANEELRVKKPLCYARCLHSTSEQLV